MFSRSLSFVYFQTHFQYLLTFNISLSNGIETSIFFLSSSTTVAACLWNGPKFLKLTLLFASRSYYISVSLKLYNYANFCGLLFCRIIT